MTIFSNEALKDRHVFITGATGGIGMKTAKIVAEMGAKVTITGRNTDKLAKLKHELESLTDVSSVFVQKADITNKEERERLVSNAQTALGFISDLVNAAGVAGNKTVDQLEEADIEAMMRVNYLSAFNLTKEIYKEMREKQQGNIVNVASLSGLRGTYGNTAYASSKFAMIGWTQSMAVEAIAYNIRVNAVCPGFVDTEMVQDLFEEKAKNTNQSYEQVRKSAEESLPSKRITTADEVANTIAFLLTDAARNIVGESVKISGGAVMR
ncbi:SDR family NAD(P)-dependent oxidoreductase [Oceanobacillus sp. J11TS1]|uniref:SDR family NAD(P)-dependent oxidoreductase n=1 Tax=Oceanobacillus sp. J11TS1 TaxID=2807191 RepID=UPI001B046651|nr:SDR family oxidoreductase [Oceanobacillus sp. J11TS1]GIO21675.1 acetoacetyl-CoA reductase [Oceanobacillus sp. J11TS1]